MTKEEYYANARRLGLEPHTKTVWINSTGEFHHVPDPTNMTPEQRAETIEVLRRNLGIGFSR
jgi:hypothetical protein